MDRYDREILMLLQTEGRISFTTLAERIALSPSATLRRVQALEAADPAKRADALAAHAAKLKNMIKGLADRDYPRQFPK